MLVYQRVPYPKGLVSKGQLSGNVPAKIWPTPTHIDIRNGVKTMP
jgi:hypothetical protein